MENKGRSPELNLLLLIALLIFIRFLWKFWVWFLAFIQTPIHLVYAGIPILAVLGFGFMRLRERLRAKNKVRDRERAVLAPERGAVYCGQTDKKEDVFVKLRQRSMHTQVIGTTNAGKTESVILPWAIQDIRQGRGLLLIDGKADNSLLEKIRGYTIEAGRAHDFKLFSLSHTESSHSFNPLIGGTAEEITERVFNAFEFENPYYRALQYEVMSQVMRILEANKVTPTFQRVQQLILDLPTLIRLSNQVEDKSIRQWVERYKLLSTSDRDTRTSGLLSSLSQFASGKTASLFNAGMESIKLDEVLSKNQIVYFQLPVLLSPFLGRATGKLILQSLQAAVANRHRGRDREKRFFGVFLDDFAEYLYPGFVTILNKSRSANVGIVFAHQALGDITALGEPVANAILTNSNLKIFMRGNDPTSAEYFSKVIGTEKGTKFTERQTKGWFNQVEKTGEMSVRDVEEFLIHPNEFKRNLGVGEAIMLVPHDAGSKTFKIKFDRYPDIRKKALPEIKKTTLGLLETAAPKETQIKTEESLNDDLIKTKELAA